MQKRYLSPHKKAPIPAPRRFTQTKPRFLLNPNCIHFAPNIPKNTEPSFDQSQPYYQAPQQTDLGPPTREKALLSKPSQDFTSKDELFDSKTTIPPKYTGLIKAGFKNPTLTPNGDDKIQMTEILIIQLFSKKDYNFLNE